MLQFHIFDWDNSKYDTKGQDKLGWVELSLAEVMANGGAPLSRKLTNGGSALISIMGEEVVESKEVATFTFAASGLDKKDFLGKSDPFLVISRTAGAEAQYSAVHKTNYIKKTLDPVWPPFSIPAGRLCAGDDNRHLRIECFDWDSDGGHDLIGECFTTLGEMRKGPHTFELINPKKRAKKSSYKNSGKLMLTSCEIRIEPTFLDYIKEGLQIHFTVAVDFTASNGDPRTPSSLHYWDPSSDNQYSAAIRAVGEIIQDYDTDKQFPALGFGGKIPPNGVVSHEFFLNGRPDTPYCAGVQGILDAYRHSLSTVALYGPTNFSPVINHVANFARTLSDGKNYFVLLILTDGAISDLANTLDAIVRASVLPMSIIIIGVGGADFGTMEVLDGDGGRLRSAKGTAARDIVQFVGGLDVDAALLHFVCV